MAIVKISIDNTSTNVKHYVCIPTDAVSTFPTDCGVGSTMVVRHASTKKQISRLKFDGITWQYIDEPEVEDLFDVEIVAGSGTGSDTYAIDLENKAFKYIQIAIDDTDSKSLTVANVPTEAQFELKIVTTATGTMGSWMSGIVWDAGTAPTLTTGKTIRLKFYTVNGGTAWHGKILGTW